MNKSWDILWQIQLRCEVFLKLDRTKAFMEKISTYLAICLFYSQQGRGKPNNQEVEDWKFLCPMSRKWPLGLLELKSLSHFSSCQRNSNNFSQAGFETVLDCAWNTLLKMHNAGSRKFFIIRELFILHNNNPTSWKPCHPLTSGSLKGLMACCHLEPPVGLLWKFTQCPQLSVTLPAEKKHTSCL